MLGTVIEFRLTEDHLQLLRRMYVGWEDCEYGAPSIDCKRPYGNSSVEQDICEILGWHYDEEGGPTRLQREAAEKIHRETQTALQIVLRVGEFRPGLFRADKYTRDWTRYA